MARKVFVSSEMSVDERLMEVAEMDATASLLWPWFLTALDDWGRCEASPRKLKARIFPSNPAVTPDSIALALSLYAKAELVILYEVEGRKYAAVDPDKWWRYQTHIHKSKRDVDGSRFPCPPEPSAEPREESREIAEVRGNGTKIVPSPSTLPPFHPSPSTPPEADASFGPLRPPKERLLTPEIIAEIQSENPDVDVAAAAGDYLNWRGSSKHRDKVQGLRNQLLSDVTRRKFARDRVDERESDDLEARKARYLSGPIAQLRSAK